jgi:cytochrome P450
MVGGMGDAPRLDPTTGYWVVTRYGETSSLLRDPRLGAGQGVPDSFGLPAGPLRDLMTTWMMALDGANHARARRLISRAFTPSAVESLRPAIEATTARLVDEYVGAGGGDLVPAIAFPLPMEVVRLLFGVEPGRWRTQVVDRFSPSEAAAGGFLDQLRALIVFFEAFVPERRAAPGDDVFSRLFADLDGDRLGDAELVAHAVLLVTAGFETTMSMISLTVSTLLQHPAALAAVRADDALVRPAIEEVLRYEPAALSTTRCALEDVPVGQVTIPAGANVMFDLAAANRDPDRYEDPDRFDVHRSDVRPLTFGGGAHLCIGAALARLETEIVLRTLLPAAPDLRLAGDVRFGEHNPTVRCPSAVPLATA